MSTDDGAAGDDRVPHQSVAELLVGYAEILAELRQRGVVRSDNAPAGDHAEWLVATALGGKLAETFSEKSWDVLLSTDEKARKIQVKARVVSDGY